MTGLTQKQIELNKQEIIILLRSTERDNIDKLITYLEKHDYFTAPASTQYHLSVVGGLAQHSLNVYRNMMKLFYGDKYEELSEFSPTQDDICHENMIISALLHDICKVDFYKLTTRNVKENGAWKEVQVFQVDEVIPILGHGSKSVIVAQQFIRLYVDEIQAISFHMGMADSDKAYSSTMSGVYEANRLALYLHLADIQATFEQDRLCLLPTDGNQLGDISDDDLPF